MTTQAQDGKPYAGNPHVRSDEGEVAPYPTNEVSREAGAMRGAATPRLYKRAIASVVLTGFMIFLAAGCVYTNWELKLDKCRIEYSRGNEGKSHLALKDLPVTQVNSIVHSPYFSYFHSDGMLLAEIALHWPSMLLNVIVFPQRERFFVDEKGFDIEIDCGRRTVDVWALDDAMRAELAEKGVVRGPSYSTRHGKGVVGARRTEKNYGFLTFSDASGEKILPGIDSLEWILVFADEKWAYAIQRYYWANFGAFMGFDWQCAPTSLAEATLVVQIDLENKASRPWCRFVNGDIEYCNAQDPEPAFTPGIDVEVYEQDHRDSFAIVTEVERYLLQNGIKKEDVVYSSVDARGRVWLIIGIAVTEDCSGIVGGIRSLASLVCHSRSFDLRNLKHPEDIERLVIRGGVLRGLDVLDRFTNLKSLECELGELPGPGTPLWNRITALSGGVLIRVSKGNIGKLGQYHSLERFGLLLPEDVFKSMTPDEIDTIKRLKPKWINRRRSDVFWSEPSFDKIPEAPALSDQ